MGGRNTVLLDALRWKIPLVSDIPTIIFGADVTHPESGEDFSPSIAAVSIKNTLVDFSDDHSNSFYLRKSRSLLKKIEMTKNSRLREIITVS